MTTARQRARAETLSDIKRAAHEELAETGAAGLALRSVARRVGLVPSALYRYVEGRDALLTALIVDAYQDLGAAAEAADPGGPAGDRLLVVARAVRSWAWSHPHDWGLLYGAPVPGYAAPQDTVAPGVRVAVLLASIVADGHRGRRARRLPAAPPVPPELATWLVPIRETVLAEVPEAVAPLAVFALVQILGGVSLELFGQYGPDSTPAPDLFDHNVRILSVLLGL